MDDSSDMRSKEAKLQHTIKTGFIFMLSVLDGVVESSYGPTVKDYQCIFQETRQRVSLLYPIFCTFKAIGTLLYCFLRQRFDPYLVASVCMIITCLLLVSLPLLPGLWLALLLTAVIGLNAGIASHARLAETGILAKDSPVPLHLFPLGLCTGSVIGPLVISSFLGGIRIQDAVSFHRGSEGCDNTSTFANNTNLKFNTDHVCNGFQSNIVYGFVIIAVIGGICFLGYISLNKFLQSDKYRDMKREDRTAKTAGKLDIMFLLLLAAMLLIGASTNFVYGNMLSTFGINSSLKISPQSMSLMTSSFFASMLIGRIIGTCVSLAVSQCGLLTVCMIGSVVAAAGLVFLAEISTISLWVSSSLFAFVYSPIFGAVIAWSAKVSRVDHVLYCLIIMADLVGMSLMSFLIGQLMNFVAMVFLNYCMFAVCVMQTLIFLSLHMISKLDSLNH